MDGISFRHSIAGLFLAGVFVMHAADFYVSPSGNDAGKGTEAEPFRTLVRARDAVRALKQVPPARDIRVLFRGGEYRFDETVLFTCADSASPGHTITYAACPGEAPVFTSTVPVTVWNRVAQPPAGVPKAVRDRLWAADLSDILAAKSRAVLPSGFGEPLDPRDLSRVYTVFRNGLPLQRARGEGFRPTHPTSKRRGPDQSLLRFPKGTVRNWETLDDAELRIIPCSYWIMNILPFESVDEEAMTAAMAQPGTYSLGYNGMTDRPSCWVENVPEFLTESWTWCFNSAEKKLYLVTEGTAPEGISVPVLTELVRVEGAIDYDGSDAPVFGIDFRGLMFTGGERASWHGNTGWGLQHDWEMFDRPSALLRFRGAVRCVVEDCTFAYSAHSGVRFDLFAQRNRVVGNQFHDIGGAAVLLAGYGPGAKDVNRDNEVSNNYVHHTGQQYWGSPAIFAWQSGHNRIANNTIHHVPYTAIVVSGRISWTRTGTGECSRTCRFEELEASLGGDFKRPNWEGREPFLHARENIVERNDLFRCMETMGDGNTIYVSGCGGGNVVRENYCHDCYGKYMNAVIRCDDDQHGTTIERNICTRTRGFGEGFINKGTNTIIENIFADFRPTNRHRGYLVLVRYHQDDAVVRGNVFYSCAPDQIAIGESRGRKADDKGARLRDCEADGNLYWCTVDPGWGQKWLDLFQPQGVEEHSVAADPLFVDPSVDDFRFRSNSPALALGIRQPISIASTGVQGECRRRWLPPAIHTTISPRGGEVSADTVVRMMSSNAAAGIHYTLDGSEPTPKSPRYAGPFVLKVAGTVNARSFAPDAQDLVGDEVTFTPPPPPILEDCEGLPEGATVPGASTQENDRIHTARVTRETAAEGEKSLKFVDGPGQKYPFNPHVYYRTRMHGSGMVGSFDIHLSKTSAFYVQWREYPGGGAFLSGPTFRVMPGGKVVLDDAELCSVPVGKWIHVTLQCKQEDAADGTFEMRIDTLDGKSLAHFEKLRYQKGFSKTQWLGFVSVGEEDAVTYIDNVELRLVAE